MKTRQLFILIDPITSRFLQRIEAIYGKEVNDQGTLSTESTRSAAGRAELSPPAKQGESQKETR